MDICSYQGPMEQIRRTRGTTPTAEQVRKFKRKLYSFSHELFGNSNLRGKNGVYIWLQINNKTKRRTLGERYSTQIRQEIRRIWDHLIHSIFIQIHQRKKKKPFYREKNMFDRHTERIKLRDKIFTNHKFIFKKSRENVLPHSKAPQTSPSLPFRTCGSALCLLQLYQIKAQELKAN